LRFHLNPLENKIIGELVFRSEGLLHVGSGGVEARRTFIKTPKGFNIPSSTWKGAFRSLSEKIAKSMEFGGISSIAISLYGEEKSGISYRPKNEKEKEIFAQVVDDIIKSLRGEAPSILSKGPKEILNLLRELGYEDRELEEVKNEGLKAAERLAERMTEDYLAAHCPIGRLYGNKVLAAKLRFTDSILEVEEPCEKPGIGIERRTGKVYEGALYFIEAAPKDMVVRLRMIADNLKPREEDSLIFASTLDVISNIGLQIGARKSVGLGGLKIDQGKSRFYIVDLKSDYDGTLLANPFKHVKPKGVEETIEWLREGYSTLRKH